MAKKRSTATRRADSHAAAARAAAIRREQERKERRRRSLVVSAVVVVVLVLIGAIAYGVQSSRDNATGSTSTGGSPSGTVGRFGIPVGSSSAPVKAVIYEDFICPYCGQFEAASRTMFQKDIDAGKLQIQYHVLNFLDRNSSTKYSTRAANALAVVLDTSGSKSAKKFHDLLFANQPEEGSAGLSDSQLVDFAVQAGAKRSEVEDGIKNGEFDNWVAKVTDQASKDHVTGTPTVRIDGKDVPFTSAQSMAQHIQQMVDAASKK